MLSWIFQLAIIVALLAIAAGMFAVRDAIRALAARTPAAESDDREQRRSFAREKLKEAMELLNDPKFSEMDHALGTGHGVRWAERMLAAKTWDEVEAIAEGEDLETVKDKIEFFRQPI